MLSHFCCCNFHLNNNRLKISVYITSYNKEKYINKSIDSVLVQTLKPDEIIIVDDCSSDKSKEIITGYKNQYPDIIKAIYNENQRCDKHMNTLLHENITQK